jgi:hypothetical protein
MMFEDRLWNITDILDAASFASRLIDVFQMETEKCQMTKDQ